MSQIVISIINRSFGTKIKKNKFDIGEIRQQLETKLGLIWILAVWVQHSPIFLRSQLPSVFLKKKKNDNNNNNNCASNLISSICDELLGSYFPK